MDKLIFYQQLKEEEKYLLETLHALQILIKRYEVAPIRPVLNDSRNIEQTISNSVPTINVNTFSKPLTITGRILNALELLGRGSSKEVGLKLVELYPDYYTTIDKARDDARFYLSKLYKEKKIAVSPDSSGVGTGRGHIYIPTKEK